MKTEEKIREAAKALFIERGYSGTKTRDISKRAGVNIASIHYYYGSKDQLFELIIGEALRTFIGSAMAVFKEDMKFEDRIYSLVSVYIDALKKNPTIPSFLAAEIQRNPKKIEEILKIKLPMERISMELAKLSKEEGFVNMHPAQFIMNLMGLTVFPFIASFIKEVLFTVS